MTHGKMCLVIAAALVALWGATGSAQGPQGTLSGVVRDGTGAALPGVTVTATNQATNASQNATTGGDGAYSLSLSAGTYSVTASLASFRRVTQRVELGAGATQQLNFSMELMLSEEVTVTAMKRESQLIDVPFSVAAPTAEVLRGRGVENLEGIAANVGGFTSSSTLR